MKFFSLITDAKYISCLAADLKADLIRAQKNRAEICTNLNGNEPRERT